MSDHDNFGKGVFWGLYLDLERQFQSFLEYVPYLPGNEDVYSFKLSNLILSIGGHVDSAFKEMARYGGFMNNSDCHKILEKLGRSKMNIKARKAPVTIPISLPLKAFEREYKLSERKVVFKRLPEMEDVVPFRPYDPNTRAPRWWEVYNGLKHDVGVRLREANLRTTLKALASAFLLNAIHIPSVLRLFERNVIVIEPEVDVIGGMYDRTFVDPEWVKETYEAKRMLPTHLDTPLFVYDYGWDDEYE